MNPKELDNVDLVKNISKYCYDLEAQRVEFENSLTEEQRVAYIKYKQTKIIYYALVKEYDNRLTSR